MQTDRMNTMILLAEICSAQRRLITVSDTLKADMARRISTEWQKLADEAIQHKVAALVLRQIRELRISAPDGLINKLKAKAANDSAVRMLLLKEWRALTEIFEKKGITCITVKGPASSIQLYGDDVEREYTDLDLFVDAADLESLVPVMSEAGYSVYADDQIVRVPRIFNFIYASEKHVKFKHNRLPIDVEIHNRLWNYDRQLFRTPNAELFADAVYVEFENRKYRTLCPIDHALYQIAHGACHGWCLIHWLLDAAVILTSSDKSFCEELASRASE